MTPDNAIPKKPQSILFQQHKAIVTFLITHNRFEKFIRQVSQDYDLDGNPKETFLSHNKVVLIQHFKRVSDSYGVSLGEEKNRSKYSKLTKRLNYFLRDYSISLGLGPERPIQIYGYYQKGDAIKNTPNHFACARSNFHNRNQRYSYDHISLKEAKKNKTHSKQEAPLRC